MFLEYAHFGQEHYITSFGRHVTDPAEIQKWHRREMWGFVPLYLLKIVSGFPTLLLFLIR